MSQEKQLSLDDFIEKKVVGEGAYGKAVLCQQKSTNQLVIVKEIALSSLSPQEQKEAWKETKVLSLLHHPNIVAYRGSFMYKNVLHIVMDYADGGDLFEQIQKAGTKHFDENQILDWFVQICLAMKHIHDRKILHRDIKCQNIFLTKAGIIKIGDFGIAKVLDHTSQFSKTAIGTPYYLSPEICQGKAYNQKSDIWSMGCVLYELCTLQHAFDSNCMNGLIMKILRSKHPPIPYYYSQNLRALVDNLLQKAPNKRPSVNQILKLDFIRSRIDNFLSKTMQQIEFSHTIFHGYKGGVTPKDQAIKEEKPKEMPAIMENAAVAVPSKPAPKPKPKPSVVQQSKPSAAQQPKPSAAAQQKHIANGHCKPFKPKAFREPEKPLSKEEILARKNAAVLAERAANKEMRAKKEEQERAAAAKSEAKRQQLLEAQKKREQERKEKMKQLEREARERKKKYDNLEAPFKKAMGGMVKKSKVQPSEPPKKRTPSQNPPSEPVQAPQETEEPKQPKKLEVKNVAKRPGKVRERDEEVRSLREMIARKRAELRAQKATEQKGFIQIGSTLVDVSDEDKSPTPPEKKQNSSSSEKKQSKDSTEEKKQNASEKVKNGSNEKVDQKQQTGKVKPIEKMKPIEKVTQNSDVTKQNKEEDRCPPKTLDELIHLSDDDDSDDDNDILSLAAIAKSILDHPPDDDEGECEPSLAEMAHGLLSSNSSDSEDEKQTPSMPKFIFNGEELKLPTVTDRDSMAYRVEAIREFIERGLGLDVFIEVYNVLTADADNLPEEEVDARLHELLNSPEQLKFYPLIQQLIVCEETLMTSGE
ncbi:serine/threonine-protein kinase Nek1-like [Histomonas meleagridis]|uniref:serine/threonine-protein kinase Nek1-like n=1 Tax=Histomonas meleagridis TaxID=135588 RepID=UPI00355975E1|nr:serine/threonine-protein kinase Nek1-like [Histomonas meleagridis]KAH0801882.1 serine/threonine-protein kinase Nek1-like [Histomonas meleagridis]